MSELEPTITEHEPTATELLRALLDERGVEYTDRDMFGKHVFHWGEPLHGAMFTDGGEWTELVVENATSEQAIAATLGDSDATAERRGDAVEVVRCRDCANAVVSRPFCTFTGRPANIEVWRCDYFWNADELPEVDPDGFCAWASRKESE